MTRKACCTAPICYVGRIPAPAGRAYPQTSLEGNEGDPILKTCLLKVQDAGADLDTLSVS